MGGERLADIGECPQMPGRAAFDVRPESQNRDVFSGVVGAGPCRVVAVIGGQDDEVAGL